MTITVVFDGDDEPTTFLLGHRSITDSDPGVHTAVYSATSPLGTAIAGKYRGDEFRYTAPSGADILGRITEVVPFSE
jgi:transcription elongation factor GreA